MDEKFPPGQLDDFGFLEWQSQIGVADDDGDGRDLFQFKRDERVADVARVQDVPDAREKFGNFRVEKSVRVGNDANFILASDSWRVT